MTTKSETMTATLQKVADLLASNPDMPLPFITIYDHSPDKADLSWYFGINGRDEGTTQKALAQSVIKAVGGKWSKRFDSADASFKQKRDGFDFHVQVKRDAVCERVVTGTTTVTKRVPDPDVIAPLIEVTEEVETVEWRCEPLLVEAMV